MAVSHNAGLLPLAALTLVVFTSACEKDGVTPVTVNSVVVTSPIGALLDVGSSTLLTARATDRSGQVVAGAPLTWRSSDPTVVSIDDVGSIRALDVGTATLHVDVGGVSGSLGIRVVAADRPAITALATEAFVVSMLGGTSAGVGARLRAATSDCTEGARVGGLEVIQECVAAIKQEAASASDPTDRVLLAVLVLFFEEIERLIGA